MDFCGCSVISFIVFPLRNDCMLLISCLLVDVLQEKTTYFPYISISKHHVFGCSLTSSHLCREGISDITYHLSFTTGISKILSPFKPSCLPSNDETMRSEIIVILLKQSIPQLSVNSLHVNYNTEFQSLIEDPHFGPSK